MEGKIGAVGKGFVAVFAGVTLCRSRAFASVSFQSVFRATIRVAKLALVRGLVSFCPLVGMEFFFVLSETPVIFKSLIAFHAEEILREARSPVNVVIQGRRPFGRRTCRDYFFFHRRFRSVKLIYVRGDFHVLNVIEARARLVFVHFHGGVLPVGGAILRILQRMRQEQRVGHGTSAYHSAASSSPPPLSFGSVCRETEKNSTT